MTITPTMIKELRERTGVGMTKCKEALEKSSGDMEEAINYLRKAGVATAVKKSSREAKEGKIAFAESGDAVALVEVSSETDFVANNERFVDFLNVITEEVAQSKPSHLDEFLKQPYSKDPSMSIEEYQGTLVQAIGENIHIKRFAVFPKQPSKSFGVYSHMGGKIVVLVEMNGDAPDVARDVAMHAAAASPDYLNPESVPESVREHEKGIAREQLAGKPENIMEKILEGKLNAFYDDVCLTRQKFVKDDSLSVSEFVAKKGQESGQELSIAQFVRWSVGES